MIYPILHENNAMQEPSGSNITVVYDVTPCSLVDVYRRF
jgi:hypothetical protein